MQNIVWKLALIVALLALCLMSIFTQPIRLGKDLRGGVSLVYKVSIPEKRDPQDVLTQTIGVLKDRVNPNGVLDISMVPLGRDRIEIVMPLPDADVRRLSVAYQTALADLLRRSEIRPGDLDAALRRGDAPATLGGPEGNERRAKITALQTAYDERAAAREALALAEAGATAPEELRRLALAVANSEIAFDALYVDVFKLSLGEARVRRTLGLPTVPLDLLNPDRTKMLDAAGEALRGPSQRENALTQIKSEFAHVAAEFDATVAAFDAYQDKRTGFDDPEDLIRLLRGAGVLEYHIAVSASNPGGADIVDLRRQLDEVGPDNAVSPVARWYPINELKQWYDDTDQLIALEADPVTYFRTRRDLAAGVFEGRFYLLLHTDRGRSMTHEDDRPWTVTSTFRTVDQLGRPAIAFALDASGGGLMGRLTGGHISEPMAIVLDGEIYSAPTIQGQITTNGQITGNFSQAEVDYLIRVLAAGSLQARLSKDPIAVNTIGPSIGQDNLRRGQEAFIVAMIAVAAFMVFYYFFAGLIAVGALVANGVIIFGVMMGIDGTFTLPGLAGIVLTVGMAVDANVLIYERIREEIFGGEYDLRGSVRQGYRKALSTILDANITNLIVCLVLFKTATTEVKGFALTLTIGICATLFTALFVTRQIYFLYTDLFRWGKLPMLPTVVPALHRALSPNIDWIGLRKVFWTISLVLVVGSVALVANRGVNMFDTEFRGGVSLTMHTAVIDEDHDGTADTIVGDEPVRIEIRHTGSVDAVEDRIRAIGVAARTAGGTDTESLILREFEDASVLTAGTTTTDDEGNVFATAFQVKVSSPKGLDGDQTITATVRDAISDEFGRALDVMARLQFAGRGETDSTKYVFPITDDELGKNIGRAEATQRIPAFLGGAVVLLENVEPAVTTREVAKRIDRLRNQPDYVRYSGRKVDVIGLTPADPNNPALGYTDLAVVVFDEHRSFVKMVDTQVWYTEVADAEWSLISAALAQETSLDQLSTFSSSVAATMAAQAVVAVILTLLGILVYIWVRFGSLRYSVAAIVALVHDVTIALGLLAASTIIGRTVFGSWLLIEPFRIDLGVVAALLTIIGYSLNDTIVILDRIRENRGKLPLPTASIVNRSINQTISRTLLTSVTTLVAVGIMYASGGSGIRPFTFCLLIGLVVGTYSSIAIAAPLVFKDGADGRTGSPGSAERSARAEIDAKEEKVGLAEHA